MDDFDKLIKQAVDKKFNNIVCNAENEWENFKKERRLNPIKKKKIVPFIVAAALVLSIVTTALAQDNIKSKLRILYENTLQNLMVEKEKIESTTPKEVEGKEQLRKDADELKKKFIDLDNIAKQVKTQEEFAEELKVALLNVKRSLEDTKLLSDYAKTNEDTKSFIEKMERKIARIEKDFAEGNKTPEQLLEELRDRSDVDN